MKWFLNLFFSLKLPKDGFLMDSPVQADPAPAFSQVIRLDENALVLNTERQRNPMLYMLLAVMPLVIYFGFFFLYHGINDLFFPEPSNEPTDPLFQLFLFIYILILPFLIAMSGCLFYLGVFRPSPPPILFDRKARKVYGAHLGAPFEMDWNRIKPALFYTWMPMSTGSMTLFNFWLVQFAEGKEPTRENAELILPMTEPVPGVAHAVALWGYISRYMDEAPEALPPTDVQSLKKDRTYRWLERGIYGGFHSGQPLTTNLREREGVPIFDPLVSFITFLFAPGLLFAFYDWFRPQTKLNPAWIPPVPDGPNPYAIALPDQSDQPLREKACRYVIAWTAALLGGGCLFWFLIFRFFASL